MSEAWMQGKLVQLTAEDPKIMGEVFARWNQNTEYFRLLDSDPDLLWSSKKLKEMLEKDLDADIPKILDFGIRTLAEDKLIGFVGFDDLNWTDRDAFVAIGIGEADFWSKGYGSDAMRLFLRYGFGELNLHRISLTVFAQNPRAIHSYEKCGFQHEGCMRECILRDGQRSDMFFMGILRREWEKLEQG
jgi:RimJ/RimL family protein N-acetyltransferase